VDINMGHQRITLLLG